MGDILGGESLLYERIIIEPNQTKIPAKCFLYDAQSEDTGICMFNNSPVNRKAGLCDTDRHIKCNNHNLYLTQN